MCSHLTEKATVSGSGKGASGWFRLSHAVTYFDHPYHSPYEHTVNIDFVNQSEGPGARVAVELTEESARALIGCIETVLGPCRSAVTEQAPVAPAQPA
jgi:hypothetical protein